MSKNPCGLDYCPYMDLVGEFANCTACSWAKALPSNVLANEQYVRTSLTHGLQKEERESLIDKIKNWKKDNV